MNGENINNNNSMPEYPPKKDNYFGDFRVSYTGVDSPWEQTKQAEERASDHTNAGFSDNFMGEIIGRHTGTGYVHVIDSVEDNNNML